MALGDLLIRVGIDANRIDKDLSKLRKKLRGNAARFSKIGSNISIGLSAPLGFLGKQAISTAAEFQSLETSLQVLTGSAEAGKKAFQDLKEFSAETPFQLQDLVSANNTLMGFGLSAKDANSSLRNLGDIAAVMGSDLGGLAVAFGQSAASGVAMTQDLNQFVNNGIPIYQLLGDITGKNALEIKEMASQSQITFPLIQEALSKATAEGGMFFEGMKKGSKTLGGVLSTFKDRLSLALGTLGESIADTINFKEVVDKLGMTINKIAKGFNNLSDGNKKLIVGFAAAVAGLGPVLFAMGSLTNVALSATSGLGVLNKALLSNPYVAVAAAIGAVAFAVVKLATQQSEAQKVAKQYRDLMNDTQSSVLKPYITKLNALTHELETARIKGEGFEAVQAKLKGQFADHISDVDNLGSNYDDLKSAIDEVTTSLTEMAKQEAVNKIFSQLQSDLADIEVQKINLQIETGKSFDDLVQLQKQFQDMGAGIPLRDELLGIADKDRKTRKEIRKLVKGTIKLQERENALKEYNNKLIDGGFQIMETALSQEIADNSTIVNQGKEKTKNTKKERDYKKEIVELERLHNDGLIDSKDYLRERLDILEKERIAISKEGKANMFGMSVDDMTKEIEATRAAIRNLDNIQVPATLDIDPTQFKVISEELPELKIPAQIDVHKSHEGLKEALNIMGIDVQNFFDVFGERLDRMGDKFKEKFSNIGMTVVAAFQVANQAFDQYIENQLTKLDEAHQKEMARIEASTASEEVKTARKALAEKKYDQEVKKLRKRQAIRDKALAIFQASINTASAITAALAQGGNVILAAIIAALGSAQIATIAATPIPMASGGILTAPTNILAGEYMGARNNPEVVAPLDKLKGMLGSTSISLAGSFKLSGNDLILAVEQANKSRIRQGGISLF